MILLPGARSFREERRSQLAFYWHARDATLQAITGQEPALAIVASTAAGTVVPRYGSTITVGAAMPRFGYDSSAGVNYLELSGNTGGQHQESLLYYAALPARDLTVFLRFTGLWTPQASFSAAGLISLGNSNAQAGRLRVYRETTSWKVHREMGANNNTGTMSEPAWTWPVDMLMTYTSSTGLAVVQFRGANGTLYSTFQAGGASYVSTARFGGGLIYVGCDQPTGGAPIRLQFVKIAMGIKTFAQMETLA